MGAAVGDLERLRDVRGGDGRSGDCGALRDEDATEALAADVEHVSEAR